jgi:hypothetical protein
MTFSKNFVKTLTLKKSNLYCAKKLGISEEEYVAMKRKYRENKNDKFVTIKENKIIEFSENVSEGTANIKGFSITEPKSAEEIESILKIDKTKWSLSSYWNKQHKNSKQEDYWIISAMVVKKKENDIVFENLENILSDIFKDKKPFVKEKNVKITNNKSLFIYTSDKHIGAYVDKNNAMYLNEYNGITYMQRMMLIVLEIKYLVDMFGTFEDIYIIDLGDRMDGLNGYTTRGGHKLPQNMSDKTAFETAITVEKDFYDSIFQNQYAANYHMITNACSNHGGVFDYVVARALEIYVNTKYPFVKTSVQEKFIQHIEYGKHVILFTHGKDTEDMKHGLPLHVNDKTENYINKYLMYHNIDFKNKTVSLIKGDLHRDTSEITYGFRYKNVLSLFGGSKWIGTNFGPTKAGCSFDIIEKNTDRIFEHKILF